MQSRCLIKGDGTASDRSTTERSGKALAVFANHSEGGWLHREHAGSRGDLSASAIKERSIHRRFYSDSVSAGRSTMEFYGSAQSTSRHPGRHPRVEGTVA